MDQQNSYMYMYMTLIGVHSTTHLMHPNYYYIIHTLYRCA